MRLDDVKNKLLDIVNRIEEIGVFDIFFENDLIMVCYSDMTWRCVYTNDEFFVNEFKKLKLSLKGD